VKALGKILPLIERLRSLGIRIETLDMGGGLGIPDADESAPSPEEWLEAVKEDLRKSRCTVIIEPGRALVGPAGIMLTKVLYLKKTSGKNFLIVDAGMNDLLRPILYGAIHQIIPLHKRGGRPILLDVVGPVCESADFLAKSRTMVPPRAGEVLAVMNVGAYGTSMSSNYNGRRRAAEVLIFGQRYALIRRREEFQDLMTGELIPELVLEACRGSRGGD
jgi:diaminopimelate decarboxylase